MKFAVLALIACLSAVAIARQADQKGAHSHALGSVDFKNSGNDAAQPAFQRGVALLHSFEYEDAAEAFREAQKADASLALAYWLEALTYSHVLWGEEKLEASRAVLNRLASDGGGAARESENRVRARVRCGGRSLLCGCGIADPCRRFR